MWLFKDIWLENKPETTVFAHQSRFPRSRHLDLMLLKWQVYNVEVRILPESATPMLHDQLAASFMMAKIIAPS